MRFIASAFRAATDGSAFACLTLAGLLFCPVNLATQHPRYGGTLRVELHAASLTLDPRKWNPGSLESAASEKVAGLIFDRLITLDAYGHFQPCLAVRWSDDGGLYRRWQFTLRSGVKFSDGTLMTTKDVVAALEPLLPASQQVSASGNTLVFQSSAPVPDLLEQLSSGPFFVYRVQAGGRIVGTGPFVASESSDGTPEPKDATLSRPDAASGQAARNGSTSTQLHFRANPEAWSGRPFVDAVEVTLGVPALKAMFDLQLGKAEVVEIAPDLVRRAAQSNLRIWSSEPVILYALRFDGAPAAADDARLREALSLSLDRGTMANVLLQKQAQPAAALLPQWLSGYAFLFSVDTNPERAKEIRGMLPVNVATGAQPLRLRVDAPGDPSKLLGERVVVNARQARILVQVVNRAAAHAGPSASDPPGGVHLFAWRYSELSSRAELDSMLKTFGLAETSGENTLTQNPEQLYARERGVLEQQRILPLVVQPEYVGLAPTVRDWMPTRWGEWHLADAWLDLPEPDCAPANPKPNSSSKPANPAAQSFFGPGAIAHGAMR
jgi:peptide/nickel transport system substrate-binding protein